MWRFLWTLEVSFLDVLILRELVQHRTRISIICRFDLAYKGRQSQPIGKFKEANYNTDLRAASHVEYLYNDLQFWERRDESSQGEYGAE
jgi:hypothetical protein